LAIPLRRAASSSFLAVLALLASLVLLGLTLARHQSVLQPLELKAHDLLLSLLRLDAPRDPRIVLVAIREADIARHGWPLDDATLAEALERLLRHEPQVVGIDLFRDRPEPPGTERLARLLREDSRLVGIMKYPGTDEDGVQPPAAIADPERIGFADMLIDPDGIVRRGLLFLGGGEEARWSLALRLATTYLASRDVFPESDEQDPRRLRLGTATYVPLESRTGGYGELDSRGYQFLLSYPAGRAGFTTLNLQQVLEGALEPDAVRGRIVILGTTASSVKDVFTTPLAGHGLDFGIELHAQATSQLIGQALGELRPLRPVPRLLDAAWTGLWCVLGGAAALVLRSRFPLALAILLGTTLLGASVLAVLMLGFWIALLPPLMGGLVTLLLQAGWLARFERHEREALMGLFTAHLSPRIAEAVWQERRALAGRGWLEPQSLEATILFSDMRGFTAAAEGMTPTTVMAWLNAYVATMTEIVSRHGGVVLELAGDGLLAGFGVPVRRSRAEDVAADARSAVRCALAMRDALRGLNADCRVRGLPEMAVRVGIHTGPLVAGTLGSKERCKYAVVGDTVNIAARLEQYGRNDMAPADDKTHCRILISDATCACLGREYRTVDVGRLQLKGKTVPVTVHRLAADGEPSRAPAGVGP
jgi:adenylate cyclase